jgi:hypothetical protein
MSGCGTEGWMKSLAGRMDGGLDGWMTRFVRDGWPSENGI